MNLARLLNEIELLYRSEVEHGIPVKLTVAALIIDYLHSFDVIEPPIPTYPAYGGE